LSEEGSGQDGKPKPKLSRPKQFEASREEFLSAALEVFSTKGYHSASVDDIAAKAGRSKGGFYHHFESKEQIYLELVDREYLSALKKIEQNIEHGDSIESVIMNLVTSIEPFLTCKQRMRGAMDLYSQAMQNPEAAKVLKVMMDRQVEGFGNLIKRALKATKLEMPFDASEIVEDMIFAGRGMIMTCVVADEVERIPDLLRLSWRIHLRAMGF
jgi:AcrR family transcriptional regulator